MAKLSLMQRVASPGAKRSGVKKNLLKQDGITSDGIQDDGSSSLSERQEKGRSKSRKKFSKLLRQFSKRNGSEEEGYESSSEVSTGSTRSTSSSFLRYQNRSIWKAKLMKKSVRQRWADGSEIPVENESKWPMFDRIYKSQNQLSKKGEMGDDADMDSDDDGDSVSSAECEDCPLAPPAPIVAISFEEEECVDEVEVEETEVPEDGEGKSLEKGDKSQEQGAEGQPERGLLRLIRSFARVGSAEEVVKEGPRESQEESKDLEDPSAEESKDSEKPSSEEMTEGLPEAGDHNNVESQTPKEGVACPLEPDPLNPTDDSRSVTVQESGIPTSEAPKLPIAQRNVAEKDASEKTPTYPIQQVARPPPGNASAKPKRSSRQKKKVSSGKEQKDITPVSIPRTICYSLRSAIGDGSTRQRNSHSLMERRPLRPNGCAVDVSYWSHRGRRNYMEDRFVIEHMGSTSKNKESSEPISLLAVFDGHGGSAASQFCSDWFSSYVRKRNEHFPENLSVAMKNAFTKIDNDFVSSGCFDGTTACAVTIAGKHVVCGNAGDSRAIIIKRDGTVVPLSQDHKPDRNDETKRINDLGGRVIHWGRWRVEGVLAVSRSIGDVKLKPYVTAEPDIVEHEIGEDDMFLVVASDGVWDTMSSDLVAKFVLVNTCKIVDKGLHVDEKLLRWISRQVSKRARENGSSDNISCIVAHLHGK